MIKAAVGRDPDSYGNKQRHKATEQVRPRCSRWKGGRCAVGPQWLMGTVEIRQAEWAGASGTASLDEGLLFLFTLRKTSALWQDPQNFYCMGSW